MALVLLHSLSFPYLSKNPSLTSMYLSPSHSLALSVSFFPLIFVLLSPFLILSNQFNLPTLLFHNFHHFLVYTLSSTFGNIFCTTSLSISDHCCNHSAQCEVSIGIQVATAAGTRSKSKQICTPWAKFTAECNVGQSTRIARRIERDRDRQTDWYWEMPLVSGIDRHASVHPLCLGWAGPGWAGLFSHSNCMWSKQQLLALPMLLHFSQSHSSFHFHLHLHLHCPSPPSPPLPWW